MKCPKCQLSDDKVLDSRPYDTYIRRRRQCKQCNHLWTTNEIHVDMADQLRDGVHRMIIQDRNEAVKGQAKTMIVNILNQL